jgi:hypothetical protein
MNANKYFICASQCVWECIQNYEANTIETTNIFIISTNSLLSSFSSPILLI